MNTVTTDDTQRALWAEYDMTFYGLEVPPVRDEIPILLGMSSLLPVPTLVEEAGLELVSAGVPVSGHGDLSLARPTLA